MGIGMVAILSVMLLPLPSSFLDVLLITNISVGLIILLTAIYSYKPLDFMVFPSLLLVTTLFRSALTVAAPGSCSCMDTKGQRLPEWSSMHSAVSLLGAIM